jgi:hypothetical protein
MGVTTSARLDCFGAAGGSVPCRGQNSGRLVCAFRWLHQYVSISAVHFDLPDHVTRVRFALVTVCRLHTAPFVAGPDGMFLSSSPN